MNPVFKFSILSSLGIHAVILAGIALQPARSASKARTSGIEVTLAAPFQSAEVQIPAFAESLPAPAPEPPLSTPPTPLSDPAPTPPPIPPPPPIVASSPIRQVSEAKQEVPADTDPGQLSLSATPAAVETVATPISAPTSGTVRPGLSEPSPGGPTAPSEVGPPVAGAYTKVDAPSYLEHVMAGYPWKAKRLHQEGVVELTVYINETGALDRVEITQSSGFDVLDQAALAAEKKSRFRPAKVGGRPVPSKAEVRYRFKLN
jgi:protein TonB